MGQSIDILDQIAKCNLTKNCIVAYTITARGSEKANFTNDFTCKLLNKNYKLFRNIENLCEDEAGVYVYGEHMRMATTIFRINCE
jgi:hypothetical protein